MQPVAEVLTEVALLFRQVYLELFKKFGWGQVGLLAEDGQEFPEYHTFLQDLFLSHHLSVVYHRKIPRQANSEDAIKVSLLLHWLRPRYCCHFVSECKRVLVSAQSICQSMCV